MIRLTFLSSAISEILSCSRVTRYIYIYFVRGLELYACNILIVSFASNSEQGVLFPNSLTNSRTEFAAINYPRNCICNLRWTAPRWRERSFSSRSSPSPLAAHPRLNPLPRLSYPWCLTANLPNEVFLCLSTTLRLNRGAKPPSGKGLLRHDWCSRGQSKGPPTLFSQALNGVLNWATDLRTSDS